MEVANAVRMAHQFIIPQLHKAKLVIDATAGNGKDTLFLAEHTPESTTIWAFDIQQQALFHTQLLLTQHSLSHKVRLVLDSHANIAAYISQPIHIAMFNLGYLPGGDHTISTCPDSTIQAIKQTLPLLAVNGLITVAAYPGYEHGRQEGKAVYQYISGLDQKKYTVACWSMVNQLNNPPILYVIEKRKE
ncbi:tRNA (mnm(5)s(2)U34)-methyltransferase [Sporomusa acidovorans]|uniref:rRNA methylase n=1 Tax=Sporomusa acidovorans (strain ATCC 49682 / DSM 3132 / Mol) TaxID=1123286 RepID=A0ABZ3J3A1_SPOA4|nr:class I SAM-dependent methyltransferase [Sporomusa acidovorans]OZC20357.1 putative rRNA methylase [Sporomusa acidovorans DSM 3132]SDD36677.1 Putative rRNA methylase [Sporomusa acidovorans]